MNEEANSIEFPPGILIVAGQTESVEERTASAGFTPTSQIERTTKLANSRHWLVAVLADVRAGGFPEAVAFGVIWLCGLIGIGVSLGGAAFK